MGILALKVYNKGGDEGIYEGGQALAGWQKLYCCKAPLIFIWLIGDGGGWGDGFAEIQDQG